MTYLDACIAFESLPCKEAKGKQHFGANPYLLSLGHIFQLTSLLEKAGRGGTSSKIGQGLPNSNLILEHMEETASSFHFKQEC